MPLFKKSSAPSPTSNDYANANNNAPNRSGSIFGRRRSTASTDRSQSPTSSNGSGNWFRRSTSPSHGNDPTILGARQKLSEAEEAERAAERALGQARYAARDATEHVKILEREAVEDARRAKAKQAEAKSMNKAAKGLGRF